MKVDIKLVALACLCSMGMMGVVQYIHTDSKGRDMTPVRLQEPPESHWEMVRKYNDIANSNLPDSTTTNQQSHR